MFVVFFGVCFDQILQPGRHVQIHVGGRRCALVIRTCTAPASARHRSKQCLYPISPNSRPEVVLAEATLLRQGPADSIDPRDDPIFFEHKRMYVSRRSAD